MVVVPPLLLAHYCTNRVLAAWVGTENYEMRVCDGDSEAPWVDRRVLAILRDTSGDLA